MLNENDLPDKRLDLIVKKFIDGKSIKSLKLDLLRNGLTDLESNKALKSIHTRYNIDRVRRAKKDLIIALILIAINVIPVILLIVLDNFRFKFGLISILALFAWRPFLKSYLTVRRDQEKLKKIN